MLCGPKCSRMPRDLVPRKCGPTLWLSMLSMSMIIQRSSSDTFHRVAQQASLLKAYHRTLVSEMKRTWVSSESGATDPQQTRKLIMPRAEFEFMVGRRRLSAQMIGVRICSAFPCSSTHTLRGTNVRDWKHYDWRCFWQTAHVCFQITQAHLMRACGKGWCALAMRTRFCRISRACERILKRSALVRRNPRLSFASSLPQPKSHSNQGLRVW
mmetsp:Transcript_69700/g.130086  ORF Transcript_69700/g.130086 Transcript_69700/m.130086 type:complete len:212 (-) Transcript_69700:75-710(-)